jgi:hypothetical protein
MLSKIVCSHQETRQDESNNEECESHDISLHLRNYQGINREFNDLCEYLTIAISVH